MKHAWQVDRANVSPHRSGRRQYLKRKQVRAERREGKRLLDEAPKRRQFKGYE